VVQAFSKEVIFDGKRSIRVPPGREVCQTLAKENPRRKWSTVSSWDWQRGNLDGPS
jgi:hypothetical protein